MLQFTAIGHFVPTAGHQEELAEKLVLQWYTQNLTWSYTPESICGEHVDEEAQKEDKDKKCGKSKVVEPVNMYDTVRKDCTECSKTYPDHFPGGATLVALFMTQVCCFDSCYFTCQCWCYFVCCHCSERRSCYLQHASTVYLYS